MEFENRLTILAEPMGAEGRLYGNFSDTSRKYSAAMQHKAQFRRSTDDCILMLCKLPGGPGGQSLASKDSPGGPWIPLIPSIPEGPGGPRGPAGPSFPGGPCFQ